MSELKKKLVITVSVIISIFLLLVIIGVVLLLVPSSPPDLEQPLTALEARYVADEIADNWTENPILLTAGSRIDENKIIMWFFKFWDGTNKTNNCMSITVFIDKTYHTNHTRFKYQFEYPINNWTIDSDKAYSIAIDNSKIKDFFKEYSDAHFWEIQLEGIDPNGVESATWYLYWMSAGFMDNPHNIHIAINAENGEVIDVY